jgi:RimJ/RimL family protein N-acetyltransferase
MTLSLNNPPGRVVYEDGGRRLELRPARVAHAAELVEAITESEAELAAFMTWVHLPQTLELQQERLEKLESRSGVGAALVFHLYDHAEGPLQGCLGLMNQRTLNPLALEIGFWIRTSAAGRGIITLATQCAVVLGFECMGLERIQCGYNEGNMGSARVCQKVGFLEEARLRYFDTQPTDETRAKGFRTQPYNVLCALFPDDRSRLNWYPGVSGALTVESEEGTVVWPPSP